MDRTLLSESQQESQPRYRRDIDGLRAIAVTSVVLFHAGIPWLSSGFVGVDIFFVISGFLIGGIIFRDVSTRRFSFVTFYARRARRILPALMVVVAVTWCAALVLLTPRETMLAGVSGASALVGASNIFFWMSTDYFAESAHLKPFLMTWSLGVEEQFYLMFPVMMLLLRRFNFRTMLAVVVLVVAISFALSLWLTLRYPSAAFYLLPSRAWELGLGVLLAIVEIAMPQTRARPGVVTEAVSIAGLVMVIGSMALFDEVTPFPGIVACLPVIGTAMLIWSEPGAVNRRLLALPPMVAIGLVSYSWYLWHWPLMSVARIVTIAEPSVSTMSCIAFVALLAAFASWRWIEQPFRRARVRNLRVLLAYGATVIALGSVGGMLWIVRGFPARVEPAVLALEKMQTRPRTCFAHEGEDRPDLSPGCTGVGAREAIALVGDSHAESLSSALAEAARQRKLGYMQFTKASCPVLKGVSRWDPLYPLHARECAAYADRVMEALIADPRVKTVLLTSYWSGPFESLGRRERYTDAAGMPGADMTQELALLQQGIAATVKPLLAAGKRVVVLGDVPAFDFDAGRAVKTYLLPLRRDLDTLLGDHPGLSGGVAAWSHIAPQRMQARRAVMAGAASVPGVEFYDMASSMCQRTGCRYADGDIAYYLDEHHLSPAGARIALKPLNDSISEARR